jgi:hypothetical protein
MYVRIGIPETNQDLKAEIKDGRLIGHFEQFKEKAITNVENVHSINNIIAMNDVGGDTERYNELCKKMERK